MLMQAHTMLAHRKALAFALSMQSQFRGFHPAQPYCRRNLSGTSLSSKKDDPTFRNEVDYDWLKRSRPIRISAKPIKLNDDRTSRKDHMSTESKIIHFQRHGQGIHNVVYAQWTQSTGTPLNLSETDPSKNPLLLPDVVDAPLTEKGIAQCQEQYQAYKSHLRQVEKIIVSPLVRALQTAIITFQDHLPLDNNESNDILRPLRTETAWVAHEGCREELGLLLCNKRRPLSEIKMDFPHIDFSHLPHLLDEDITWINYSTNFADDGIAQRETIDHMSNRCYDFLVDFVRHLPEREIAVVGHSAWLHAMCNAVLDYDYEQNIDGFEKVKSVFGQAELRTMEITYKIK